MKHQRLYQLLGLVVCATSAALITGCSSTRAISDVALGAGGAYLGHELSDGNRTVSGRPDHWAFQDNFRRA